MNNLLFKNVICKGYLQRKETKYVYNSTIDDEYIEDDVSITLNQGGSCEQEIYEFVLKDIAFNIMNLDFELIEDEIDIDSIEHKELEVLQKMLGQCDLFKGNEKYILKVINENNSRLVDAILKVSKENETLVQAVKQLNKEVKELEGRK